MVNLTIDSLTKQVNALTLIHRGGTELRRAMILNGTVNAYVLDFNFSNAAFISSSSLFSTLSLSPFPSPIDNKWILLHKDTSVKS